MALAQRFVDPATFEASARTGARLADELLKAAMVITHADAGHVQVRASGRASVRTVAQAGLPRSFGPVVDGDPSARSLWRRVLDARRRVVVADLFDGTQAPSTAEDALRAVGLHATQTSPIIASNGDVVGMLSTHTRHARTFSDEELSRLDVLLERVGDFLGPVPVPAVARVRPAATTSEEIRKLHDDLPVRHLQIDLRSVVGQAVDIITPDVRVHGHELTVCLGADPAWVAGDQRRLVQVFTSLLRNAVTHTAPSGQLSVFVHVSRGFAAVHISDNGCGIARESMGGIYARRAPDLEDRRRLLGDLSLVELRRMIEHHDGELIAHSDGLGHGSRFVVRLPVLTTLSTYRSTRRP